MDKLDGLLDGLFDESSDKSQVESGISTASISLDEIFGTTEKKKEPKSAIGATLDAVSGALSTAVTPSFYGGLYDAARHAPEILVSRFAKIYDTLSGESLSSLEPTEREKTIEYIDSQISKGLPKDGAAKIGGEVGRSLIESAPDIFLSIITPGGLLAKTAVGIAGSGASAGLASRYDFLKDQKDFITSSIKSGEIKDFKPDDWGKLYDTYATMANYYGASEAIPSALGAAIQIPLLIAGPAGVPFIAPIAKKLTDLASKFGPDKALSILKTSMQNKPFRAALSAATAGGTELAEEVATQILQSAVDSHPDIAKRSEISTVADAIGEVGVQSLLGGSGMQIAADTGRALYDIASSRTDQQEDLEQLPAPIQTTEAPRETPGSYLNKALANMPESEANDLRSKIAEETGIIVDDNMDIDEENDPGLEQYITAIIAEEDATNALSERNAFVDEMSAIYEPETIVIDEPINPDFQKIDDNLSKIDNPTPAINKLSSIIKENLGRRNNPELSRQFMQDMVKLRRESSIVQQYTAPDTEQNKFAKEILSLLDGVIPASEVIANEPAQAQLLLSEPRANEQIGRIEQADQSALQMQDGNQIDEGTPVDSEAIDAQPIIESFTDMIEESKSDADLDQAIRGEILPALADEVKPSNTSNEAQTETLIDDAIADDTYETMNNEMDVHEYDDNVSSGVELRNYALLTPESVQILIAIPSDEYLAARGMFRFDDIDMTEYEYISYYDNSLMDGYQNAKEQMIQKPSFPVPSEPLIFKSLGERIASEYEGMRSDKKAKADAGLYTELDYIKDYYPNVLSRYVAMIERSGTTLDSDSIIERTRQKNKDKADMVSPVNRRKVIIRKSKDGGITATMSYLGTSGMGKLTATPSQGIFIIKNQQGKLISYAGSISASERIMRDTLQGALFYQPDGVFYTEKPLNDMLSEFSGNNAEKVKDIISFIDITESDFDYNFVDYFKYLLAESAISPKDSKTHDFSSLGNSKEEISNVIKEAIISFGVVGEDADSIIESIKFGRGPSSAYTSIETDFASVDFRKIPKHVKAKVIESLDRGDNEFFLRLPNIIRKIVVSEKTINGYPASSSVSIDPRFSVRSPGNVPLSFAQEIVNKMQKYAKSEIPVQVVAKVSDLPQNIIDGLPQTPKGKYLKGAVGPDGKIYIVSDNMADPKDVYVTLIHELAHKGFDNLVKSLGRGTAAYDAFMVQLMNDTQSYRDEIDIIASDYGYDVNTSDGLQRATIEWLSYRAERVAPSAYRRFKNAINRFFRAIFGFNPLSVNDIDLIIDRVRDFTQVGNTFYAFAFNVKPTNFNMPESAERQFQKGHITPNDSLTAMERLYKSSTEWLGKISNKASWLSQFGIDTTKKDMNGAPYSIADDILRRITESEKVGANLGLERMKHILELFGNDSASYGTFKRFIYLRDLQMDIERGVIDPEEFNSTKATRHGFKSIDEFNQTFDAMSEEVGNHPIIKSAVERRDSEIVEILDKLKELKLIPVETPRDPRYFHHAVLKYMDDTKSISGGDAIKKVKGGEAKGRTETQSEADIYMTNYIEAEGQYFMNTYARIHLNLGLREIGSTYDIKKDLNSIANNRNKAATIEKETEDLMAQGLFGVDLENALKDQPMAKFKQRIAIISNEFEKLNSFDLAAAILATHRELAHISHSDLVNEIENARDLIKSYMPEAFKLLQSEYSDLPPKKDQVRKLATELVRNEALVDNDIIIDYISGEGNIVRLASAAVRDPQLAQYEDLQMLSKGLLSAISKRKKYMKETLGKDFKTYREIIRDAKNNVIIDPKNASEFDKKLSEYTEYNPQQNPSLYHVSTVSDFALTQALINNIKNINIEDLRSSLAQAAPNNWVIPNDLAEGLNNFKPYNKMKIPEAGLGVVIHRLGSLSRMLLLFSPERVPGYFSMNAMGDFSKAAVFFPKAIASYERNKKMLGAAIDFASGKMGGILDDAVYYRVVDSGMYMRDIETIRDTFANDEYLYSFLTGVEPKSNIDKYIMAVGNVAKKIGGGYFQFATKANQIRENFQRLVVFDYVLEEAKKGNWVEGVTPEYIREGVKRLGPEAYAARIARDGIGDYGNISENGLAMRNSLVWFYGYIETNFTGYFNFMRNAAINALPEGFSGNFKSNSERVEWLTRATWNISKNAATAAIPAALLVAAGAVAFPDEAEELMRTVFDRGGPILIPIGKKDEKTGYIPTVSYSDTYFDFLSWIGIENPYKIGAVLSGQRSMTDVVANAPVMGAKKMIGSLTGPLSFYGVVSGQSYFPDVFNPRPIERDVATANLIGVGGTYKWIAGHPKVGAGDVISKLPRVSYISPGEISYRYAQKLVNDVRQKSGLSTMSFDITRSPRDYAKYMYRKSIQYGDKKSADRWLEEYIDQGGNRSSLRYDMKTTDPFSGLNGTGLSKSKFLSDLNPIDRKTVIEGENWWRQFYGRIR